MPGSRLIFVRLTFASGGDVMRVRLFMVIAAVAAFAAAFANEAAAMGGACSSGQVVKTASYVFALQIGPSEQMYTAAEVKAKHPKTGEEMLSGTMAAMTMASGNTHHLEVHICNMSGSVVMGAHPSITVDDPSAKTMMMSVPIAIMEGIGMGSADYHYGNNVELTAGHHVTVTVTLKGQRAVFHAIVSKSGMAMNG
jgi:hypothetical protein